MIPAVALFAELSARNGVGTAARGTIKALETAGFTITVHDIRRAGDGPGPESSAVNLIQRNPSIRPPSEEVLERFDRLLGGRRTIGYWVWEAPEAPGFWEPWLPLIDELWVPSSFVAQSAATLVRAPIVVIPHPIDPRAPDLDRKGLGLPEDKFIYLFAFDASSRLKRKNPLAAIRAYRQAFPADEGAALLVLKGMNINPGEMNYLRQAVAGRRDILLLNKPLDAVQIASLFAACDCYVSLHRAEGFGLTIAEAMFFAKPVIATNYSGNLDFQNADNSYLVDHVLKPLDRTHGVLPVGMVMAEPDEAQAARLMRQVFTHRDEARAVGERAAAWIRAHLSPAAVGERMRERITALASR